MSEELFSSTLLTVEEEWLVEELNDQYGGTVREPGHPVERLLRRLAAWALGTRLAGSAFPDDASL
ncbi:hypothetical protein [Conexibacter sp. DBS9H8]|uniref:hypothetical protein n=1 Tax=Conexibacter sp. DBS9H8 TaxID=2937801 RepID=UPI0020105364|nr:hypothetical protein [Conexibacter sp. DBS9H8]